MFFSQKITVERFVIINLSDQISIETKLCMFADNDNRQN